MLQPTAASVVAATSPSPFAAATSAAASVVSGMIASPVKKLIVNLPYMADKKKEEEKT